MEQALDIRVYGRVQGVGFRPAVCRLGLESGLKGWVRNNGGIVEIVAAGEDKLLTEFLARLRRLGEPIDITGLEAEPLTDGEFEKLYFSENASGQQGAFFAVASSSEAVRYGLPADLGICAACLGELNDPADRRFGYPYISCAQCGPRYTVLESLPYDRQRTALKVFPLCPECAAEYGDMRDRRGRGETIACHVCGPRLQGWVKGGAGDLSSEAALARAQNLLQDGHIVMVKAVGGYNLVCRAGLPAAVDTLRRLKHRPTKPLAVMADSLQTVKKYCCVTEAEERVLQSPVRPIVLLEVRKGVETGYLTCAGRLGVFLPPVGLYQRLCAGGPLVVTSCNFSGGPILYEDGAAWDFYRDNGQVAGFFADDRRIVRPADDSVVQVFGSRQQVLRRTKGLMPEPVILSRDGKDCVLGVGAQTEPSFCLTRGSLAYPAQVPGNFEETATEMRWLGTLEEWQKLLDWHPSLVVGDLHPDYCSTRLGRSLAAEQGVKFLQVQHHQAHALSVMAEQHLQGPVLAVCWDGTGYGTDGSIWGGEFLVCDGPLFRRPAHLESVPMLGGDESVRQAWKTGVCYTAAWAPEYQGCGQEERIVRAALARGVQTIENSSMGRLFDGAAALLGLVQYSGHEGHCAQVLERAAQLAGQEGWQAFALDFTVEDIGGVWEISGRNLWHRLLEIQREIAGESSEKRRQELRSRWALGFHLALVDMAVKVAENLRRESGINQVVLTGGCFVNRLLRQGIYEGLERQGFQVYTNEQVPCGDGGIALGQAYFGLLAEEN